MNGGVGADEEARQCCRRPTSSPGGALRCQAAPGMKSAGAFRLHLCPGPKNSTRSDKRFAGAPVSVPCRTADPAYGALRVAPPRPRHM